MTEKPKKTPSTTATNATSPAISAAPPAAADGLTGEPGSERDNLPPAEPPAEEESETAEAAEDAAENPLSQTPWRPAAASAVKPAPIEPDKFAVLQRFIAHDLTLHSVEAQVGRMVNAQVLSNKSTWQTKRAFETAARALAKLRDPKCLASYWRAICFLRGRTLGSPRAEALLAASMAILDVVAEMMKEVTP